MRRVDRGLRVQWWQVLVLEQGAGSAAGRWAHSGFQLAGSQLHMHHKMLWHTCTARRNV